LARDLAAADIGVITGGRGEMTGGSGVTAGGGVVAEVFECTTMTLESSPPPLVQVNVPPNAIADSITIARRVRGFISSSPG
jgi:hypothetical protein